MTALAHLLFLLFVPPFWESRPPAEWTNAEVKAVLTESPWVQGISPPPVMQVVFATAKPVEEAEAELFRRGMGNPLGGAAPSQAPDIDYLDYIREHRQDQFVLAIPYADLSGFSQAAEERRLEEESVMRLGRKRIRIVGHFPPTPSDRVLRLIFPRAVTRSDKTVAFDLYLPGVPHPARLVEFRVRDLMYHGNLEM
jgi:hypothetical protein